ncbi:MAG: 3-deoxy-8-phosphooctulonate synthase [Planctomycetota bacterium]
MTASTVQIDGPGSSAVSIGGGAPLCVICGPCSAESESVCLEVGAAVQQRCAELGLGYIFKASFDKANRSSIHSDRGPGLERGLALLGQMRETLGAPVTTDIHEPSQAEAVGAVVDAIQIPAFLCRQTDLLVAAAETGKVVNAKKGQFLSPGEMTNVVAKLEEAGAAGVVLTERGTFFGYNRLVNDFAGLGDLMELGPPVCFDATHSTQQPGGRGTASGGRPERAALLAGAAVAAGVDAVFVEAHPDPKSAVSDAASMLDIPQVLALLDRIAAIRNALG